MAVAVSNSLSELDAMLNDMRNHKYSGGAIGGSRTPNAMDDYRLVRLDFTLEIKIFYRVTIPKCC